MQACFEIKYLELTWYNKNTLSKITESLVPLDIEYNNDTFIAETTIYPKVEKIKRGVLAFRYLDEKESAIPYLIKPNNNKIFLESIKDPDTNKIWWFLKDSWDNKNNQWLSIAPNIIGSIHFVLNEQRCNIIINGYDFTLEQLELYLKSFKNSLWQLILDDNSLAQVETNNERNIGIDKNIIKYVNNLLKSAENILINPKIELREIQKSMPRKYVKPVNRTFMELATKSDQRFITSRAVKHSYNVSENRYVLFALQRCYKILKQIIILFDNKIDYFINQLENHKTQYNSYKDYIKINRNLFVEDFKRLIKKEKDTKIKLNNFLKTQYIKKDYSLKYLQIKLGNKTHKQNGFYISIYHNGKYVVPNNQFYMLILDDGFDELNNILKSGMEINFLCVFDNINIFKNSERKGVMFKFIYIHKIDLLYSKAKEIIQRKRKEGIRLSNNNWIRKLEPSEKKEQEQEKSAILNRIKYYNNYKKEYAYFYKKLQPKLILLNKIIKRFNKLSIKPSSYFPSSMTFLQNPHYQSIHKCYKNICKAANLQDDDLLLSMEEIDKIGIINVPLLYERWVLLQIILTFKIFRFIPQTNWKYQLINAIKNNKKDIRIELENKEAKRYITLSYERMLDNGRRPDFILDLKWFLEHDSKNSEPNFKRFILDAKFYNKYTFEKEGGLLAKINELYIEKDYSEGENNPVFLVHPCNSVIKDPVSPQNWAKFSYLGETSFLNDNSYPEHNKGAILLNPIDRILHNNELQRLLGLFLQYKLENNRIHDNNNFDNTQAVPICIRCGSSNFEHKEKPLTYYNNKGELMARTERSVWLVCKECEQWQVFNHCWQKEDEQYIRLIKNGIYWSYHSADPSKPYNINCPSCGQSLLDKFI